MKIFFGLIGYPIKHSLSPCMQNAALKALKIKARYKLFELQPHELAGFLANLKKRNIQGFNVTIPYKEKVIPYLNSKSQAVSAIGAVNTVVVDKAGKIKGFNTDYLGFSRHLKNLGVKPKRAALLGAGGAARAICFALGKMSVKEICIYDIDKFKVFNLISQFKDVFEETSFSAAARISEMGLENIDLLINASSVGMKESDPCLITSDLLHDGIFVYDLIYNPKTTKLLALADQLGLKNSNGLGMLLYQGALSFKHFTLKEAPIKIMQEALNKGILQY